jgi:hypothetical protein
MINSSPIPSPPPELVQQWHDECHKVREPFLLHIATQAAQWGADQELEACEMYLAQSPYPSWAKDFRAARRPKPPSLKEQALDALELFIPFIESESKRAEAETIRRALEALPND